MVNIPNTIKVIRQLVAIKKDHYTKKGENHDVIQMKAFIFKKIWPDLKANKQALKPEVFMVDTSFKIAWNQIEQYLVKDRERVLLLKKLEECGLDLLRCTDIEVRDKLIEVEDKLIEENRERDVIYGIKYKSIKNKCSRIRSAFKVIGREHSWGEGTEFMYLTQPLINSGNPMTLSSQQHMENAAKQRRKKMESKIKELRPDGGGVRTKDALDSREGFPANISVAYFALMQSLLQTIKWCLSKTVADIQRIENMASLSLILAFVLHEGCRPNEIFKCCMQDRLYFPISLRNCNKVYWLTLVFCKIDTLIYILENNLMKRYIVELWKGKKAQRFLNRSKSVIPFPYNSMDLLTIYIIVLRVLYHRQPDLLSYKVVPKTKKSWSYILRRMLHKFEIKLFTFYAMRYSAAEEDQKYGIDPDITRERMGHSDVSQIYKQYADNLMARAAIDSEPIVLGSDVIKNNPDEAVPMEFRKLKGSLKVEDAFEDQIADKVCRDDFCRTAKLVGDYLERNDGRAFDILRGRQKFISKEQLEADIRRIPFGFNFDFPNEIVPSALRALLENVRGELSIYLNTQHSPRIKTKMMLWSYTQVMYGNWENVNVLEERDNTQRLVNRKSKVKLRTIKLNHNTDLDIKVDDSIDFEDIADVVAEIGVGNYICVYSERKDRDTMLIPSVDKNVWLMEVVAIGKKKVKMTNGKSAIYISGYKFFNKEQDITQPFTKTNKIIRILVDDDCLLKIYSDMYDDKGKIDFDKEDVHKLERIFLGT